MSALINKDEYGVLRPVDSHGRTVYLPDKLSGLLELAADSMESLDKRIYFPTSQTGHKSMVRSEDGKTLVNYAGAIMVAELGVTPSLGDVSNDDFDTEEDYAFQLKAVTAVSNLYDVRDGILLNALCEEVVLAAEQPCREYIEMREDVYRRFDAEATPEQAAVVAKWAEYASLVDLNAGYGGWVEAAAVTAILREIAHDCGKVGW